MCVVGGGGGVVVVVGGGGGVVVGVVVGGCRLVGLFLVGGVVLLVAICSYLFVCVG